MNNNTQVQKLKYIIKEVHFYFQTRKKDGIKSVASQLN